MNEIMNLSCPSCGSKLNPSDTTNQLTCASCGNRYLLEQNGNSVTLKPATNSEQISGNNNVVVKINNMVPQSSNISDRPDATGKKNQSEMDSGECPICGRLISREKSFRCKSCLRTYICQTHQDQKSFLCSDCVKQAAIKPKKINKKSPRLGVFSIILSVLIACISLFSLVQIIGGDPDPTSQVIVFLLTIPNLIIAIILLTKKQLIGLLPFALFIISIFISLIGFFMLNW